jgi:hypothetical protein
VRLYVKTRDLAEPDRSLIPLGFGQIAPPPPFKVNSPKTKRPLSQRPTLLYLKTKSSNLRSACQGGGHDCSRCGFSRLYSGRDLILNVSDNGRGRLVAVVICIAGLALLIQPPTPSRAASPETALDGRAWELVSPVEKNGGDVQAPGGAGAGALQAAPGGGAIGFGSATSFGQAEGAAPVSQYLASRSISGWSTANLTPALLAGTYSAGPYQLFSTDLSRALLSSGWGCRGGALACPEENPPLGPGAPAGYRNLYQREGATYTPLITTADMAAFAGSAEELHVSLAGATPDLRHVILAAESNLFEWSKGGFEKVNTAPGAALAAPAGAISADGSRVYFTQEGNLYLRKGGATAQVDLAEGGGGTFEAASADGAFAFFTKGGELFRFDAQTAMSQPIAAEVQGVLGASADGTYVYYLSASGLFLWHSGTTVSIAPGSVAASPSDYPPAIGTARVTADGTRLVFLSTAALTASSMKRRPNTCSAPLATHAKALPLGPRRSRAHSPPAKEAYRLTSPVSFPKTASASSLPPPMPCSSPIPTAAPMPMSGRLRAQAAVSKKVAASACSPAGARAKPPSSTPRPMVSMPTSLPTPRCWGPTPAR